MNINKNSKIFITGHNGLVGSSICRLLKKKKYKNLVLVSKDKLNLLNKSKVLSFLKKNKPELIICCAAKVGGILSNNKYPADYLYQNLLMELNIIHSAYEIGIKKIIFLASSCIYPKLSKQPIKENYLLTGPLEKTNEGYALAKIIGLKMCEYYYKQYYDKELDYRCIMPTNLFGKNDNYDLENSHVIPALIRKIHNAKMNKGNTVIVWGTGNAKRDFLSSDELAKAILFIMKIDKNLYYSKNELDNLHINIGSGNEYSIKEITKILMKIIGFKGKIIYDKTKPDGTPRKILDCKKLKKLGFKFNHNIFASLKDTYNDFLINEKNINNHNK
jgi:GDP-L-fucose synthase